MKKLILIVSLLWVASALAQNVDLTLQVDMNVQILQGNFDPVREVVRCAGSFQDWSPSAAPNMTDENEDGIFQVTYSVAPNTTYYYKYVIGDNWGNNEGDPNREAVVGNENLVMDPVPYNRQDEVSFPAASPGKVILHLAVDMSRQKQIGNFNPSTDVVRAAGSFQDWSPSTAPDMVDATGNLVYVTTYEVDPNTTYYYKFVIGTDWGVNESDPNRESYVATNDTAIAPVYYNREPYDPNFVADSVNVTFQLDMSVKIKEGLFGLDDRVCATGSWQGSKWLPLSSNPMTDLDGDSIYVSTERMTANVDYKYKFHIGLDENTGYEDDPQRDLKLGLADTTLPVALYNRDSVVSDIKDGTITFSVDMTVMAELGLFDPSVDSVWTRGSFNGWADGADKSSAKMNQDFLEENLWFLEVPFEAKAVGDQIYWKHYVDKDDSETLWKDNYERPLSQAGGNRSILYAGTMDQVPNPDGGGFYYFEDVHPDWVIPEGTQNFHVNFSVDMGPAQDPGLQAIPFDPATDTLYWVCEQPTFTATQGWTDTDKMKVLKMTDENEDDVYTGTLSVTSPGFNAFEYRYGWVNQDGTTWTWEPESFGSGQRVRFVGQDVARNFPALPWNMPMDTWTNSTDKSNQVESDPFTSYTDIAGELIEVPKAYALMQNFPNPFNPVTKITFTIAKTGHVSLEVFNIVGEKVRTLINGNATAGTHIETWNGLDDQGHKVASGIYFYKLKAGDFVSTKKMVLVK